MSGLLSSVVFVERGDEWVCCYLLCLLNDEMSGLLLSVVFVEWGDEWSVVICCVCRTRR